METASRLNEAESMVRKSTPLGFDCSTNAPENEVEVANTQLKWHCPTAQSEATLSNAELIEAIFNLACVRLRGCK